MSADGSKPIASTSGAQALGGAKDADGEGSKGAATIDASRATLLAFDGARAVVVADTFRDARADATIADDGDVLLALSDAARARARRGRTGVVVEPTDDPRVLAGHVDALALVAVSFPSYKDGRGYTHARRVRDALHFRGELRALGDVGVDQLHFLARSGFTSFALRPGTPIDAAIAALARFPAFYNGVVVETAARAYTSSTNG
jgi:uncharacterized protein (DUF934 family)